MSLLCQLIDAVSKPKRLGELRNTTKRILVSYEITVSLDRGQSAGKNGVPAARRITEAHGAEDRHGRWFPIMISPEAPLQETMNDLHHVQISAALLNTTSPNPIPGMSVKRITFSTNGLDRTQPSLLSKMSASEIDFLPSSIETIGENFCHLSKIAAADLAGLRRVRSISRRCFSFGGPQRLDLSGMKDLQMIGDECCIRSPNLRHVTLAHLLGLTIIGNGCFSECNSLQTIDLRGLISLRTIGNLMCTFCPKLDYVYLGDLPSVESIGYRFFSHCTSMKIIDISGMTKLRSIDWSFCPRNESLVAANFAGLACLESIGDCFLSGCVSLAAVPCPAGPT